MDVEAKADASPVTIADRQAEEAMRALIVQRFPQHGVFGEEHGFSPGVGAGADYLWVLDPIDGTKSFVTGARCSHGGGARRQPLVAGAAAAVEARGLC